MKTCAYCGRENDESAFRCRECGTEFKEQASTQPGETASPPRYAIPPLPPGEMGSEWATLLKCRTLAEADFIASEIKAAGMDAIVPDQFMIEAGSFRVQVAPKDHEAARKILNETGEEV